MVRFSVLRKRTPDSNWLAAKLVRDPNWLPANLDAGPMPGLDFRQPAPATAKISASGVAALSGTCGETQIPIPYRQIVEKPYGVLYFPGSFRKDLETGFEREERDAED
jgi:hypothetical protein